MPRPFQSIYSHRFVRAAVCIPRVRVADPAFNLERTLALARRASETKAALALFPELGITAYTNDDLFQQSALLEAAERAVATLLEASAALSPLILIGAPLRLEGRLYNCALCLYRERVLGITPKSYLPNYREYYEKRQFTSGLEATAGEVRFLGRCVPFGSDLVFNAVNVPDFSLHMEICEDLWAPIPPSTYAALAGATLLANLSASNATIGKADYRRSLCASQSAKCLAAYLYAAAGPGESTTDLAWDGHGAIYENYRLLSESVRFAEEEAIITADIDLERLAQERMRTTSFNDAIAEHRERVRRIRSVEFQFQIPEGEVSLRREVERFPYVPSDPHARDERCSEAYHIQVQGLTERLRHAEIERVVIGISGGLDSTQALLVATRAIDRLGLPRENIYAYTLPGFATSRATLANARGLMQALRVRAGEIDIKPSCLQMLRDLGHPMSRGEPVYDITFENVQAGERTSHLFRLANLHGALVVGTGDLSELALGWTTYGVGDHMSHYNVNASLPKTLIQHLIRWMIDSAMLDPQTNILLQSILETEISPELVPAPGEGGEGPAQRTEDAIGPYELQDFNLYYLTRYGLRPSKVAFLSHHAWHDRDRGLWPAPFPPGRRHEYDLATIKQWLGVFLQRFFKESQFKRSCAPNAPKVGSGGSLSPRGDWRAPSDSEARVWLSELHQNVPD